MKAKYSSFLWILIIIAVTAGLFYWGRNPQKADALDGFAQCLASKNITMYGAYWCPHCANEKEAFGDSFKYVPYVECTKETKLCLEKNIKGYPTWIFGDGRRFESEMGIAGLARESGCELATSN